MHEKKQTIDGFLKDSGFSGVLSIYKNGQPVYQQGSGYRDIPNRVPNNPDTIFGIASGTKTFTAIAVIKLIELGHIELSTTVGEIFGADMQFISPDATVKHLLNHTSGIYDYYDEELATDFDTYTVAIPWPELETPTDYLPLYESQSQKFEPGYRVSYSNGGYVFLGMIIEKLSGLTYRDFLHEHIFAPLHMNSTGFYAFNALPGNVAWGYISTDSDQITNIYQLPIRGGGDGGLYTNSRDLNTFWTQLFGGGIISAGSLAEMAHGDVEIFPGQRYGLGLYVTPKAEYTSYSAIGGDAGVGFSSFYVPTLTLNINIQSNMTDGQSGVYQYLEKEMQDLWS